MAIETRVAQKDKLFALLEVKKAYEEAGIEILPAFYQAISRAKAVMDAEDIAYVEKQIEQGK